MPAMMKGYIDRVFARGFAYGSRDGVVHGLLSGRKSVLITVSGAPLPLLVKSGNWNAVPLRIGAWSGFGTAPAGILHERSISTNRIAAG